MDINEEDDVLVKHRGVLTPLGDGFTSEEEIEAAVRSRIKRPGEYEYGVFSGQGKATIPEPTSKRDLISATALERLDTVESLAEGDNRVENFSVFTNSEYSQTASVHTHTIRYEEEECDFGLTLNNSLFDEVPLGRTDPELSRQVRRIAEDIFGEHAVYMGFKSGFASRGRRDPYVRVFGRVHRETPLDEEIRSLEETSDVVEGLYRSRENITPVQMYSISEDSYNDEDVIAVLDVVDDRTGFDPFEEDMKDQVMARIDEIEADFDFSVSWIGKVPFNRTYSHVCLGLTHTPE